jgi:hypothetical protein
MQGGTWLVDCLAKLGGGRAKCPSPSPSGMHESGFPPQLGWIGTDTWKSMWNKTTFFLDFVSYLLIDISN